MPTARDIAVIVNQTYLDAVATGAEEVIVFAMDTSSQMGRLVCQQLPQVALGIDTIGEDEVVVSALPTKAAIALFNRLDAQYGARQAVALQIRPPEGHFWAVSFTSCGIQIAPIPIPEKEGNEAIPRKIPGVLQLAVEGVQISERVAALRLSPRFLDRCIGRARADQNPNLLIDMHYYHFNRDGRALCICVVLHRANGAPISVLLESEAQEMKRQIE